MCEISNGMTTNFNRKMIESVRPMFKNIPIFPLGK